MLYKGYKKHDFTILKAKWTFEDSVKKCIILMKVSEKNGRIYW